TDRAYSNLGTVYYQLGRYPEAVAMNEKAVELGAGSSWVTMGNLADCYRRVPDMREQASAAYGQAIKLAERQLALNPIDANVLKSLAFYRAASGDKIHALRDIQRALKIAPADTTVAFKAVLIYELLGRRAQALAALEQ